MGLDKMWLIWRTPEFWVYISLEEEGPVIFPTLQLYIDQRTHALKSDCTDFFYGQKKLDFRPENRNETRY